MILFDQHATDAVPHIVEDQTILTAILHALENGDRLESIGAIHRFNTTRLAMHIHKLRKSGHPIRTEWGVSTKGKRYGIYSMGAK